MVRAVLTTCTACPQEGLSQLFAVMPPGALPGSNIEAPVRILQVRSLSGMLRACCDIYWLAPCCPNPA